MRHKLFYSLLLLFALAFGGCEQEDIAEANDEGALLEEDSEITTITVDPIAHLSFDSEQDDSEVEKQLQRVVVEKNYAITNNEELDYYGTFIPKIGETFVMIKTKTGSQTHAKTDSKVTFRSSRDTSNGGWNKIKHIVFNMDNPNKNDREKGNVDYFYYKVTYDDEHAVRLNRGTIKNHGSDGWYCDYLKIWEKSWKNWSRGKPDEGYWSSVWELYDFNAWVDTDDQAEHWLPATNYNWLQVNIIY